MPNGVVACLVALVLATSSPSQLAAQSQSITDLLAEGRKQVSENRLPEALATFRAAVTLDSTSVAAWRGVGSAHHRLEQYPEALAALDRALVLAPRDFAVRFNRGLTLSELGRIHDAVTELDSAIAIRPDFAPAWTERGAAKTLAGRVTDARSDWTRAIALDSTYIWSRYYRALAAVTDGDYRAAAADLDAVTAQQQLLSAHLWRWIAYRLDSRSAPPLPAHDADWPGPVAAFLKGQLTEAALIDSARVARLPLDDRRLATAWFFIAQMHLAERRLDSARDALRRVGALRVPRHAEVVAAEAQLYRLGGNAPR